MANESLKDDATALDILTMRRWNLILRVFMSEYLNLRPDESNKNTRDDSQVIQKSSGELVSA